MPPDLDLRLRRSSSGTAYLSSPAWSSSSSSNNSFDYDDDSFSRMSFRTWTADPRASRSVGNLLLLQYELGSKGSVFGLYSSVRQKNNALASQSSNVSSHHRHYDRRVSTPQRGLATLAPAVPPRTWSRSRWRVRPFPLSFCFSFFIPSRVLCLSSWSLEILLRNSPPMVEIQNTWIASEVDTHFTQCRQRFCPWSSEYLASHKLIINPYKGMLYSERIPLENEQSGREKIASLEFTLWVLNPVNSLHCLFSISLFEFHLSVLKFIMNTLCPCMSSPEILLCCYACASLMREVTWMISDWFKAINLLTSFHFAISSKYFRILHFISLMYNSTLILYQNFLCRMQSFISCCEILSSITCNKNSII